MLWPVVALLVFVAVAYKLTELMSTESKCRRRRRRSNKPILYKGERPMVKLS